MILVNIGCLYSNHTTDVAWPPRIKKKNLKWELRDLCQNPSPRLISPQFFSKPKNLPPMHPKCGSQPHHFPSSPISALHRPFRRCGSLFLPISGTVLFSLPIFPPPPISTLHRRSPTGDAMLTHVPPPLETQLSPTLLIDTDRLQGTMFPLQLFFFFFLFSGCSWQWLLVVHFWQIFFFFFTCNVLLINHKIGGVLDNFFFVVVIFCKLFFFFFCVPLLFLTVAVGCAKLFFNYFVVEPKCPIPDVSQVPSLW